MGRSPCCQQDGLKKGPWTPEEDQKLIAYVKEHGHGNWRALPKRCGLLRCGKSCRLRWTNYLRPDIKRGLFSDSEEQNIIQLHALVGNKWAFIASQLPKRTDNEIKNYWNTVLKKRVEKALSPLLRHQRQKWDEKLLCKQLGISHTSPKATNMTSMMSSHLAQWESARLEAEARLVKESKKTKTSNMPSSLYNMSDFPSYYPPTTTLHATQSNLGTSSCPHQSTINPVFSHIPNSKSIINSTCSLISLLSSSITMDSTASRSKSSVSSSKLLTSALSFSKGRLSSALKLGPDGKLSWDTQELSFTESPLSLNSSPQQNRHAGFNKDQEEFSKSLVSKRDYSNTGVIYNTLEVSSTLNLHDILFEVEDSCSNGMMTWEGKNDVEIEDIDDVTCNNKGTSQEHDQYGDHVSGCHLELENIPFFHFDAHVLGTQCSSNNFLISDDNTICTSSAHRLPSNLTSIVG